MKIIKYLLFLVVHFVFGQQEQTRSTINNYIDYVNECNLYITASHYSVKDYNMVMNRLFEKPEKYANYSHPSKKIFELKCYSGTIKCNEKLNLLNLTKEYVNLKENIEKLELKEREELEKSLTEFQKTFKQFTKKNKKFEEKNGLTKEFFENKSNLQNIHQELVAYKLNVAKLNKEIKKITQLCAKIYKEEKLPPALELSKQIVLTTKKLIQSFKKAEKQAIQKELVTMDSLFKAQTLGTDLMKMEKFGDFKYTDNHNTQQRANIEREAIYLYKKAVKIAEGKQSKQSGGYKYGIRTYTPFLNKKLHAEVHKIEILAIWLNDNKSYSIISGYNKYIQRANKPILKMIGEVIPFQELKFGEADRNEDTKETIIIAEESPSTTKIKTYFKTLEGAKINNLVLLLDVSMSMRKEKKLEKLKHSIKTLIDILRKEDILSVIVYATEPKVLFSSKGNYNKVDLKEIIEKLRTQGGTNTKKGLLKAYSLCEELFMSNGNNKIIIATDGFFRIDKKDKELIENKAEKGISLSTFHYRSKTIQTKEEKVLKKMSKLGKGIYKIINDKEDASKALINEAKK